MPYQPTGAATRIDTLLTDMAMGYGLEITGNYICDVASTNYRTPNQSDKYLIWNKGDLRRVAMEKRAKGKAAVQTGISVSNTTFFCEQYALATKLPDEDRTESQVDVEAAKVRWLMHQAKLKRDAIWAANCFVASVWSGFADQTGVASGAGANQFDQWDDYTNSTPLTDISSKLDSLRLSYGGKIPPGVSKVAVVGPAVHEKLKNHPDFVDRIKYTSGNALTEDIIASLIGLDKYIVGQAAENTAHEGQTTTMADLFGKSLWLGLVADTYGEEYASAVTTFSWSPYDQVTENGAEIRTWRKEEEHTDYFESQIAVDVKVTAADLGGIFLSAVA